MAKAMEGKMGREEIDNVKWHNNVFEHSSFRQYIFSRPS